MASNSTRRHVLAGLTSAGALLAMGAPAQALTTQQASALIGKVVDEVNTVISSGQSQDRMIAAFEKIFARYADVPIIARSALGVAARSASSPQMNAFTEAFQGYMARKYGKRFREFQGGKIEVSSAKQVKSFFEVSTTVRVPGSAPYDVKFLVSDKSGKDLFFNLIIEGINMLASEREEIGAMLDSRKGNLDLLIRDLKTAG
ncbi:MlaC/ttg2D family ABC transporter substrate-binding protein [Actibacterium pelagium]|uniref:ABC transporter n=1 Tax=Actibacterium pelagium TaxID=2029103 RepID=A0A917EJ76_9RHOB|nr:ABC transporter substrate-binding protein [Actibacterium pelagium]GGE49802.1 ABC transporter [Actibacterium pelagium]